MLLNEIRLVEENKSNRSKVTEASLKRTTTDTTHNDVLRWLEKNLKEFGDGMARSPKYWDARYFFLKADFKGSEKIELDFQKKRDQLEDSGLPQEEEDDAMDKSYEDETKAGAVFTKARKGKLFFNAFDKPNQMTLIMSARGLTTKDLEKWWQEGFVPGVQKKFPDVSPVITKIKIDNSGASDQGDGPIVRNNTAFTVTWTV